MQDLMAFSAKKVARIEMYAFLHTVVEGHVVNVKLARRVLTTGVVAIKAITKTNQSFASIQELF